MTYLFSLRQSFVKFQRQLNDQRTNYVPRIVARRRSLQTDFAETTNCLGYRVLFKQVAAVRTNHFSKLIWMLHCASLYESFQVADKARCTCIFKDLNRHCVLSGMKFHNLTQMLAFLQNYSIQLKLILRLHLAY